MKLLVFILILLNTISNQAQDKLTASEIYKKALPAIAVIETDVSQGSGVIMSPNGIIATNFHVIEGAKMAKVSLSNGDIYDDVEILDTDQRKDIAILKIKAINLQSLSTFDSDKIEIGSTIYTIGAPKGLSGSISSGIISSIRASNEIAPNLTGFKVIQFTAPVSPGSSGGALLNESGELIGLVFANKPGGQNLNLAIPVNYVSPLTISSNPKNISLQKMIESPALAKNEDEIAGTYIGNWSSNSYPVSGKVVFNLSKVSNEYQANATFTGSEYFTSDTFKISITKISEGIYRMDFKGNKSKITGTGLFTNGRFDGDYRFRKFLWVDTGQWSLLKK